jgi:hypothetical protein
VSSASRDDPERAMHFSRYASWKIDWKMVMTIQYMYLLQPRKRIAHFLKHHIVSSESQRSGI